VVFTITRAHVRNDNAQSVDRSIDQQCNESISHAAHKKVGKKLPRRFRVRVCLSTKQELTTSDIRHPTSSTSPRCYYFSI